MYPYAPQQNGVAERKNHHILEAIRTLLLEASVPASFWVEVVRTIVYLINQQTSPLLSNTTPYARVYQKNPTYASLHTFGCVCYVHLPPHEWLTKLTAQFVRCVFLGYATGQKGIICYDPDTKQFRISHNVVFFENQLFYQQQKLEPPSSVLHSFADSDDPLLFNASKMGCATNVVLKEMLWLLLHQPIYVLLSWTQHNPL